MEEAAETKKPAWYFKTSVVVIAILSVGPLALPLVWCHPRYSAAKKIAISAVVLALTYFLWEATRGALKSLGEYYEMLS